MEQETKDKAIEKLDGMKLKVVGPSKYEDYSHFNNDYSSIYEFIDHYYKWDWDELEINRKMYKLHDPETEGMIQLISMPTIILIIMRLFSQHSNFTSSILKFRI